jgi:hypothetical protein
MAGAPIRRPIISTTEVDMLLVKAYLAPSPIHGIGVFAGEPIPAGKIVEQSHPLDHRKTQEELDALPDFLKEKFAMYSYKTPREYVLAWDETRYMNHSFKPNTKYDAPNNQLIALRDISQGEELTCDYREFDCEPERFGIPGLKNCEMAER